MRLGVLTPDGTFTVVDAAQREVFHAFGIGVVLAELLGMDAGRCWNQHVWVFESMTSGPLAFFDGQPGPGAEDNAVAQRVIAALGGVDAPRRGAVVFAAAQDGGVVGLSDLQLDDLRRALRQLAAVEGHAT